MEMLVNMSQCRMLAHSDRSKIVVFLSPLNETIFYRGEAFAQILQIFTQKGWVIFNGEIVEKFLTDTRIFYVHSFEEVDALHELLPVYGYSAATIH